MILLKLLLILVLGEFIKNGISFNPLLTYMLRFHKITMISNITGNYIINQFREVQYINAHIRMNSNKLINNAIITFDRCDQAGIKCEYWQSWKFSDLCKMLKEQNQIWSRWYNSFKPRVECPIDKEDYEIRNGTLDIGSIFLLYPEASEYRWNVNQTFYSNDIFIGGYKVEASYFGYRKRNKLLKN